MGVRSTRVNLSCGFSEVCEDRTCSLAGEDQKSLGLEDRPPSSVADLADTALICLGTHDLLEDDGRAL